MKSVRYAIEAAFLWLFWALCRVIGVDAASALGGFLARMVGPRLAASRKARRHIMLALPDLSDDEVADIIRGMWDNLGRVVAEYPHLSYIAANRLRVIGQEHLQALVDAGKGAVLFSAHLANWEAPPTYLAQAYDIDAHLMYRAPNNKAVDRMIHNWRTKGQGALYAHNKSRAGGQAAMRGVKGGGALCILIDQKYNEGVDVPFFGHAARTNPFFVKVARKYDTPLVPVAMKRVGGAHFEMTILPPLILADKDDMAIMAEAHTMLEQTIASAPEQWLWLHRRWRCV